MNSYKREVIESMEGYVSDQLQLLKSVEDSWQANDYLPDMSAEGWEDNVRAFRTRAAALPDDILVALVGDMITEEALPTYQTLLNTFEGVSDTTGTDTSAWAKWSRGWTAEENRHGDLLNKYLFLTGRVDMRAVEVTIHHLIRNGFNPQAAQDPYKGFVYTSFQERATKISHSNVARIAQKAGESHLKTICGLIAGDEARHEKAYTNFVKKILEVDPAGGILAFRDLMRQQVVMPAHLMTDGQDPDLFDHFSTVTQRLGVYTANDYADIIQHLVRQWELETLCGLEGEAAKAQDYLCKLGPRFAKLAERNNKFQTEAKSFQFSWIYNRSV